MGFIDQVTCGVCVVTGNYTPKTTTFDLAKIRNFVNLRRLFEIKWKNVRRKG